jgi:hypothetical protein
MPLLLEIKSLSMPMSGVGGGLVDDAIDDACGGGSVEEAAHETSGGGGRLVEDVAHDTFGGGGGG